jgi:cellulose synthase/poly-beta-1,6-N-acetylglucosamine synthase-like glycosyltransferase
VKTPLWHVSVLIPARNEEELLPRCLNSVMEACAPLPTETTVDIVVAVDSSTDRTQEIAERMLSGCGAVVSTKAGIVGWTRALAARIALDRYGGQRRRCWLANTDADSCVPAGWLSEQLALAANNVEAVAGTVEVDSFDGHNASVPQRFRETYLVRRDGSHSHVHGANFGVRADAYLRAGGWRKIATAEDHDLWNRLAEVGARRQSVSQISVLTSGRRVGRAPNGFAGALSAHNGASEPGAAA